MTVPKWLLDYYGRDFDVLNPAIIAEWKSFAVVSLRKVVSQMHSSVGYVLIEKGGFHGTSKHVSLHEGVLTTESMQKMTKALIDAEAERDKLS